MSGEGRSRATESTEKPRVRLCSAFTQRPADPCRRAGADEQPDVSIAAGWFGMMVAGGSVHASMRSGSYCRISGSRDSRRPPRYPPRFMSIAVSPTIPRVAVRNDRGDSIGVWGLRQLAAARGVAPPDRRRSDLPMFMFAVGCPTFSERKPSRHPRVYVASRSLLIGLASSREVRPPCCGRLQHAWLYLGGG